MQESHVVDLFDLVEEIFEVRRAVRFEDGLIEEEMLKEADTAGEQTGREKFQTLVNAAENGVLQRLAARIGELAGGSAIERDRLRQRRRQGRTRLRRGALIARTRPAQVGGDGLQAVDQARVNQRLVREEWNGKVGLGEGEGAGRFLLSLLLVANFLR